MEAIDLRGYAGQWIAERPLKEQFEKVEIVTSASTYHELIQQLKFLGISRHQVAVTEVPTADSALLL
ncbi:MAG: hypothetical protein ACREN8_12820 [Candidatus Dormibacteraceae bacterium]